MKSACNIFRTLAVLLFAWAMTAAITACSMAERRGPVILAASSLQPAMEELSEAWVAKGHDAPVLSFAGSAALARQIENGAPADIFISADRQWTDLIAGIAKVSPDQTQVIAQNALLVARSTRSAPIGQSGEAAAIAALQSAKSIATGDPASVPLGAYARQALTKTGTWAAIEPRIIPAGSAQAALKLVLLEEAELGILYASDAARRSDLGVIWQIPGALHEPIHYRAMQLPASAHPETAEFLAFLTSDEAREILLAQGFTLP